MRFLSDTALDTKEGSTTEILKPLRSWRGRLGFYMKVAEVVTRDEREFYLCKKVRDLEAALDKVRIRLGEQREIGAQVAAAIVALEPMKRRRWRRPAKPGSPVIAVLALSDLHIGEITKESETEGFGWYNWKIAQARFGRTVDSFLRWVNVQRFGYRIDGCTLLMMGDYISGDIHRELSVTNEFPVPVQAARAATLLANGAASVAAHFAHVRIIEVGADNHGRLTPKPQFKQKSENNMSYLVQFIVNGTLAKHGNIEIDEATGGKKLVKIAGWPFLVEHGDSVRSWSYPVPWYGIEREEAREARRRMNTDRGFKYHCLGHFHTPSFHNETIINGSLSGTNEYDHLCGRHSLPAQVAFLVHPEHGVFNFVPFRV